MHASIMLCWLMGPLPRGTKVAAFDEIGYEPGKKCGNRYRRQRPLYIGRPKLPIAEQSQHFEQRSRTAPARIRNKFIQITHGIIMDEFDRRTKLNAKLESHANATHSSLGPLSVGNCVCIAMQARTWTRTFSVALFAQLVTVAP